MASTNKTALGLVQYGLDDIPDQADTNEDNRIITEEFQKRPAADSDGKYANAIHSDTAGTADYAKDAVAGSTLDTRVKAAQTQADKYTQASQAKVNALPAAAPGASGGLALYSQGIVTYTHVKTGTAHALTGPAGAKHLTFMATASFTDGDTFTVNGTAATAKTIDGAVMHTGDFVSGQVVSVALEGSVLTFQFRSYYAALQTKANVAQLCNPNLLVNADFCPGLVNQRRLTEYSGVGYGPDCWKLSNENTKVSISDDISISSATGSYPAFLFQILENSERLTGQQVTLSALIGGKLYTVTHNVSHVESGSVPIGANARLMLEYYNNNYQVTFRVNSGSIDNIMAVKLELGSVSTLTNDPPQNIQQELARCQRYLFAMRANNRYRMSSYSANGLTFTLPIPTSMRTGTPQIIDPSVLTVKSLSGVVQSGFTFSCWYQDGNGDITIQAAKTGHGLTDGYLSSDATNTLISVEL